MTEKKQAKALANDFFMEGVFTSTRLCPGKYSGEWLVVDDDSERAVVVFVNSLSVEDGFDYQEAIEKYDNVLEEY